MSQMVYGVLEKWEEQKHPRKNDGKFAPKGGGSGGRGIEAAGAKPKGKKAPALAPTHPALQAYWANKGKGSPKEKLDLWAAKHGKDKVGMLSLVMSVAAHAGGDEKQQYTSTMAQLMDFYKLEPDVFKELQGIDTAVRIGEYRARKKAGLVAPKAGGAIKIPAPAPQPKPKPQPKPAPPVAPPAPPPAPVKNPQLVSHYQTAIVNAYKWASKNGLYGDAKVMRYLDEADKNPDPEEGYKNLAMNLMMHFSVTSPNPKLYDQARVMDWRVRKKANAMGQPPAGQPAPAPAPVPAPAPKAGKKIKVMVSPTPDEIKMHADTIYGSARDQLYQDLKAKIGQGNKAPDDLYQLNRQWKNVGFQSKKDFELYMDQVSDLPSVRAMDPHERFDIMMKANGAHEQFEAAIAPKTAVPIPTGDVRNRMKSFDHWRSNTHLIKDAPAPLTLADPKNFDIVRKHAERDIRINLNAGMSLDDGKKKITDYLSKIMAGKSVSRCMEPADLEAIVDGDGRFKSQFETGKSGGMYDPVTRNRTENFGIGFPGGPGGEHKDKRLRPIYGFIPGCGGDASGYGSVEVSFAMSVRKRATFTCGNSLSHFDVKDAVATPMDQPGIECIDSHADDLLAERWQRGNNYLEAQIHGGAELHEVAKVILHKHCFDGRGNLNSASARLEKKLKAKGIQVEYDKSH